MNHPSYDLGLSRDSILNLDVDLEMVLKWILNQNEMFGSRSFLAECLANSKTYRSASRSLNILEFLPLKSHYRFSSSLLII